MMLTIEMLRETLDRFGGVLRSGRHTPPAEGELCQVCVRELRSVALGLPWSDAPDDVAENMSPTDRACARLNDARWSTDQARTEACLPLALLSEATAPTGWVRVYTEATIRVVVPLALRATAVRFCGPRRATLIAAATRCEREGTREAALEAASSAGAAYAFAATDAACSAADAADAAYATYAAYISAANAAADAATAVAANAASTRDLALRVGVALLIAAHAGPRPWEGEAIKAAVAECMAKLGGAT